MSDQQVWRKEFPPGSGVFADYNADELRMMKGFRDQLERGEIPEAVYKTQVECIHALKADFGVTFPPDAPKPPEPEPVEQLVVT